MTNIRCPQALASAYANVATCGHAPSVIKKTLLYGPWTPAGAEAVAHTPSTSDLDAVITLRIPKAHWKLLKDIAETRAATTGCTHTTPTDLVRLAISRYLFENRTSFKLSPDDVAATGINTPIAAPTDAQKAALANAMVASSRYPGLPKALRVLRDVVDGENATTRKFIAGLVIARAGAVGLDEPRLVTRCVNYLVEERLGSGLHPFLLNAPLPDVR